MKTDSSFHLIVATILTAVVLCVVNLASSGDSGTAASSPAQHPNAVVVSR